METRGYSQHGDGERAKASWFMPLAGWLIMVKQGTYTKIFVQFPEKFWFDTEVCQTTVSLLERPEG